MVANRNDFRFPEIQVSAPAIGQTIITHALPIVSAMFALGRPLRGPDCGLPGSFLQLVRQLELKTFRIQDPFLVKRDSVEGEDWDAGKQDQDQRQKKTVNSAI